MVNHNTMSPFTISTVIAAMPYHPPLLAMGVRGVDEVMVTLFVDRWLHRRPVARGAGRYLEAGFLPRWDPVDSNQPCLHRSSSPTIPRCVPPPSSR